MTAIKLQGFDLEQAKQAKKLQSEIKVAIDNIFTNLNYYGNQDEIADAIIHSITSQHRTLQQDFWRVMVGVIAGYGELEYCDGRNQGAVDLCKRISNNFQNNGLPRI